MGRKIITTLYEFVMTQPETKPAPTTVPTTPKPQTPPAPSRPGRPVPIREPRPEEEERPIAKKFDGVMGRLKKSLTDEKGTELAKNLLAQLKELKNIPLSALR